ncbi:MAG: ATP-grasp domain-containing protein [Actinobacteria bacterium]|nr:ATP-grasp domain-containing protein [Actinomycetota bacterium]
MTGGWLVLLESNTTGSGRRFCAAARRFGLRPVVFARDPDRYPYLAEDRIEVRRLDTGDRQAVHGAVTELPGGVAGVTSSSEYFVAAAAELAAELDRPHPDPGAVAACRDKGIQRRLLHDGGLAGPAFAVATDPGQAADRARELGMPVVLKPASGSGSVGVRLCSGADEVTEAAEAVLAGLAGIPAQRAVLVEQYLDGPEFSVETFGTRVVGITAKHVGAAPYFVETGHDFPAALPAATGAALAEAAVRAVVAVGLGWGPAHVELRLTAAGPAVVEVNPRLAGGMIPDLVRAATGVDLVAATVAAVAGLPVELEPDRDAGAAIRFLVAQRSGRLAGVAGLDRAAACPQVTDAVFTGRAGRLLTIEHSFRDRLGYLIATGRDGRDAGSAADRALAFVRLLIDEVRQPVLLDRR